MRFAINVIAGLALMGGVAIAHPGHNVAEEAADRRDFLQSVKRASLAHCADKLKARGVHARNTARRAAQVEKARKKRGLKKRDLDTVLATSHNETDQGFTVNTDAATLFTGINSCVLTPEVTQGPYYVAGEYVRESLVEDQGGLDIVLDYQVIDVDTCEPIPDVYLEMWHCNSTGVYSGIIASGNGDSTDETNIDNTWLRGIQLTDEDGVAQFESIFPGHYTGRTTHIHILIHTNATLLANQTLGSDNYASHVGQAFFDQDLITEVELLAPYNTNTQDVTTNDDDSILSEEVATDGVDPVMEYTLLGDSVSDGLFAWLAFGINSTLSKTITPAAFLYAEGGVANENSGSGSGGGSGGPDGDFSGTAGSGGNPTGTPPADLPAGASTTTEVVPTTTAAENSTPTSSAITAPTNGVGRKGYDATVILGCIGAAMVAL
ncbi:Intradiol ring-cleavage dioxygenase [Dactylonectria estremocensis]|uniref:Intradiol ring-cleavage dioxygenase n=1 Tax=Dactylonectria estremocensis TaxID=1079267 RepID=A0A9P9J997_9HYPO|nr:Intradiol ring-cleavage dioxygenase [Dactylonectria estremocensis]